MNDELETMDVDVIDAAVVEEPVIDCGLWSRWIDIKGRLFVVVERWEPQLWNGKFRSTRLRLLEVDREFGREVSRGEFEGYVTTGALIRVTD